MVCGSHGLHGHLVVRTAGEGFSGGTGLVMGPATAGGPVLVALTVIAHATPITAQVCFASVLFHKVSFKS